ncbi:MAG TPA: Eco57I restriction-modification methylase domain-containing protein [Pyrinomonadaceae bacterium]
MPATSSKLKDNVNLAGLTIVPSNYSALASAVLSAWARAHHNQTYKTPSEILQAREIRLALEVLPVKLCEDFCSWFKELSTYEINGLGISKEPINSIGDSLFSADEAKGKGAIFTPDWLAQRTTYEAFRHWKRLNPGKGSPRLAGDLSCGPGAFLSQMRETLPAETFIVGVDSCAEYVCLARLDAVGRRPAIIECLDTLVDLQAGNNDLFIKNLGVPVEGYDLIVGNPPYIRSQLLKASYSRTLKRLYPQFTSGNFDLVVLFLAQTLSALAPGGIASLIVSNKFMASRYGMEICRHLASTSRILEIMDFGDGQVFPNKVTYTCAITFSKLPPVSPTFLVKFPPGLKWDSDGKHLELGQKSQLPLERLQSVPWNLTGEGLDEILHKMQRPEFPRLMDVFSNISQGVRTGANHIFVIKGNIAQEIEPELLYPYVSGENIRRGRVVPSHKFLLWPYRQEVSGAVLPLRPNELERDFPKAWSYLLNHRQELTERDLEPGAPWYGYSRSQNLELQRLPKILAREMMPWAEFAADPEGQYSLCSGYAFVAPMKMDGRELHLWAAVLSTPTMEFQLRLTATQLHSGWFRILKHHLKRVRLPQFSDDEREKALRVMRKLNGNPSHAAEWERLDALVAASFGLSAEMRRRIRQHLDTFHATSQPERRKQEWSEADVEDGADIEDDTDAADKQAKADEHEQHRHHVIDLTPELRQRYIPVELPEFYALHRSRENFRRLVTFSNNKSAPIHRWYKYTQGYSGELVTQLLDELGFKPGATVYDPFVGSGTTTLTCRQLGFTSFGAEISPFIAWVARQKVYPWDADELQKLIELVRDVRPEPRSADGMLFREFFSQAYAPEILTQIIGWRAWIVGRELPEHLRSFMLLGLVSILEDVSQIRKHGSHYRYLNKVENIGISKLNIPTIDSGSDVKPILLDKLEQMCADVRAVTFRYPLATCDIYCSDATTQVPEGRKADIVITSPPYLNRNNYIAQQKGEIGLLRLLTSYEDYRELVRSSFRSHVESHLPKDSASSIPEVQSIVNAIELTENNNAKIPHMVSGYFDDLQKTLRTLLKVVRPGGKLAFVVGNSRWGGVVVPVDHLLALIAQRLGYEVERIFVTRLKGNSPQQMRRYGRIPMRESIVILRR